MSARVQSVTRQGAVLAGPSRAMTAAEAAVWPVLQPYAGAGSAFCFNVDYLPPQSESDPRPFLYTAKPGLFNPDITPAVQGGGANYGGTPTDQEVSGFYLVERVSNRIFAPCTGLAHPEIILDDTTGKPCLVFGAGGHNVNILSTSHNGAMRPISILDWTNGAEKNDYAVFSADQAYSFAAKYRVPAPNTTVNGVAFGSAVGGALFAGASDTSNNNPIVFIQPINGHTRVQNRNGVSGYEGATDRRDGVIHTVVGAYDPVANRYSVSTDGGSFATFNSGTGIIGTDAAALRLSVGGMGTASPLTTRFTGFLYALLFIPATTWLTDATALANVQALLAEK